MASGIEFVNYKDFVNGLPEASELDLKRAEADGFLVNGGSNALNKISSDFVLSRISVPEVSFDADITDNAVITQGYYMRTNGVAAKTTNGKMVEIAVSNAVKITAVFMTGVYSIFEYDVSDNIISYKSFERGVITTVETVLNPDTVKVIFNCAGNSEIKIESGNALYVNVSEHSKNVLAQLNASAKNIVFTDVADITESATVNEGYYVASSGNLVSSASSKAYTFTVDGFSAISFKAVFQTLSYSIVEFDSENRVIKTSSTPSGSIYSGYHVLTPLTAKVTLNTAKDYELECHKCALSETNVNAVADGLLNSTVPVSKYDIDASESITVVERKYLRSDGSLQNKPDSKVISVTVGDRKAIKVSSAFVSGFYSEFYYNSQNQLVKIGYRERGVNTTFEEILPANVVKVSFNCRISAEFKVELGFVENVKPDLQIENITNELSALRDRLADRTSAFDRGHSFGCVPSSVYKCMQQELAWGDSDTTYSDVIEQFDTLVDGVYCTKESIGYSSDSQELFIYKFCPSIVPHPTNYTKGIPGICVMCGQHGFEKGSVFGMWYFLKDLVSNSNSNDLLRYLRNNVNIYVVPVANPYGFDENVYLNANNVNLNRNWAVPGWTYSYSEQDPSQNSGDAPFDQPETAAISNFVLEHKDEIDYFVDFHTNGRSNVSSIENLNWISIANFDLYADEYSARMVNVLVGHAQEVSSIIREIAGDELLGLSGSAGENQNCCNITQGESFPTTGFSGSWAISNGIISHTFEGFNAFITGSVFVDEEKKCMASMIACLCKHFLAEYGSK